MRSRCGMAGMIAMGTLDGGQRSQTLQNSGRRRRRWAKARGRALAVGIRWCERMGRGSRPVLARLAISLVVLGLPGRCRPLRRAPPLPPPHPPVRCHVVKDLATRAIIATSDAAITGMTAPPSSAPFVPGEVLVTTKTGRPR